MLKFNKKILFININFRSDNSSGITVSKLIDQFSKENLYLLSTKAEQSNIDIFEEKYQIGETKQNTIEKKNGKKNKLKILFKKIIGSKSYFTKLKLTTNIKNWIDNIKPDYIYLNPDRLSIILFAQEIAAYCNAKIIIHVMDDKVNIIYPGIIGLFYKNKFQKLFSDLVVKSDIRLSISELMATDYKRRYGVQFHAFHNPIVKDKWLPYQKQNIFYKKDIKIIYSGAVESSSAPILQFCEAISRVDNQYNFIFNIYTNNLSIEVKRQLNSYPFVKLQSYVPYEKIPETITKADFLLLPLPFEHELDFIRLSMSTKTAEYMITGVPIFVFAPSDTALAQYALKGKWGHIIDNNDLGYVTKKIVELIENVELQKEYSLNAINLAINNHSAESNKTRFLELISQCNGGKY